MAASKKKSLPLRHLTDTFTNQREQMLQKSHLQERWQELKERELNAQQNNRQLLQQFDEAQDTLREMITLTADMTTIRMEYERYLEESYPRWQQQLERKAQSAQRQSMEEYLRSCLKNREERVSKSSADRPFNSKGPTSMSQQMAAPPNHYSQNLHMDYNQHGSPRLPYIQTSWQPPTQFQRARFPIRAQHQPQGYSHVPPSFPQHPDPYHHQHLDSPPGYHHSRQDAPGWAPLQPGPPWSLAAGAAGISACSEALWGPLYREEPPPEIKVAEEVDTSLAPSSKREGGSGGRSSHFSQELDIKPVRLYGGPAESSESSRESSQGSREKKRGTSQKASLDSCSSHESSESSSAIVIAAATAAQHSEGDASSEKSRSSTSRRKRRGGGLAVGSPSAEKPGEGSQGENSGSHREESRSTSAELGGLIEEARIENGGNQRHGDNSESCGEESGSQREEESGHVSVKIENRGGDEIEKQESNSSEQSSVEGKEEEEPGSGDGEENGGGAEEKENSQTDEEQEERDADDDDDENVASEKNNTTDKEEETGSEEEAEDEEEEKGDPEEEKSEMLQIEDGENQKRVSTSSQDEDEDDSEGGEENTEDEESDEDEQRGDEAGEPEEERDSDDSIISPQQNRSKKMNVIPEENSEEEEEGIKTGSSEDEISDDDVENLLAPQDQSEKEEKDLKAAEKPKAICDNVEIFQVEPDRSTKSDHPSDSDEFDQFYE